jgi:hypothetical protein
VNSYNYIQSKISLSVSSLDSDVDRYVIIKSLLESIFNMAGHGS